MDYNPENPMLYVGTIQTDETREEIINKYHQFFGSGIVSASFIPRSEGEEKTSIIIPTSLIISITVEDITDEV